MKKKYIKEKFDDFSIFVLLSMLYASFHVHTILQKDISISRKLKKKFSTHFPDNQKYLAEVSKTNKLSYAGCSKTAQIFFSKHRTAAEGIVFKLNTPLKDWLMANSPNFIDFLNYDYNPFIHARAREKEKLMKGWECYSSLIMKIIADEFPLSLAENSAGDNFINDSLQSVKKAKKGSRPLPLSVSPQASSSPFTFFYGLPIVDSNLIVPREIIFPLNNTNNVPEENEMNVDFEPKVWTLK